MLNNTIIISIDKIIYAMSELEFFQLLCRKPYMDYEYISLDSTLNTMYESLYESFKRIKFVEKTNSQKRREWRCLK